MATACMYLRRFYVRRCLCEYDPRAVAPACLYLAAKAEEAQAQAKALFHFMKKLNAAGAAPARPSRLRSRRAAAPGCDGLRRARARMRGLWPHGSVPHRNVK